MIELKLKHDDYYGDVIYDIYIDGEYAGALEGNYKEQINSFFIDNIKKNNNYKGHDLLKQVIEYLHNEKKYDLGCLPLPKYRSYYEELGFKEYFRNGEDIFYNLPANQ